MHRNILLNLFREGRKYYLTKTICNYSQYKQMRLFHTELQKNNSSDKNVTENKQIDSSLVFGMKYQVFQDQDAPVILDVTEESILDSEDMKGPQEIVDPYKDINLKKGVHGIFDIGDLVDVLNKQKAKHLCVVTVPKEYAYVDHLVIVTGRSQKHMIAMAEFVRAVAKRKNISHTLVPKIEGAKSPDWIALDIGNIALHIFSSKARMVYDLESLWALGADYDEITHKEIDAEVDPMAQYNAFIDEFQPAETE